jgi:hypothetical protein
MGKLKPPEIDQVFSIFEPAIIKQLQKSGVKEISFDSGGIEFRARGKLWKIFIKNV